MEAFQKASAVLAGALAAVLFLGSARADEPAEPDLVEKVARIIQARALEPRTDEEVAAAAEIAALIAIEAQRAGQRRAGK